MSCTRPDHYPQPDGIPEMDAQLHSRGRVSLVDGRPVVETPTAAGGRMTIWCDGCRRMVSQWTTVFRSAPVYHQGKRVGYVATLRHATCRTVVHVPTRRVVGLGR